MNEISNNKVAIIKVLMAENLKKKTDDYVKHMKPNDSIPEEIQNLFDL